ncbi:uncharacterized protein EKO05_0008427 [Ascochyta rabiei]|uniref:Uncharacterized protein n=1 Tax=Didymella rabiei TaxID=5454 RepID=A0A163D9X3_DIDRA|nr:uncharacterized protein EKO05_0008427 [Ascochyta rabiei]KZM23017.1 hypothetical protein ST47_g5631 [Ascochyta rabiei]UPX18111.1 hypothetical protein EKO05_0008427 [Ascochyta rabiei]
MAGVEIDQAHHQASKGRQLLSKDDLYFNDMDIRAWERRTAALGGAPNRNVHGYPEDEGYYDDSGELMSAAEYEEVLFQRVLDKIRLARAADMPDVQLTPEELDAYQSKLHGTRASAARSPRSPRPPPLNDTMSVANTSAAGKKGASSSRSKKEPQRSSLFASKPKKDKVSSHKRTASNAAPAPPPGFMIPGPDGQPIYTPINAYQGSLARDPVTPPQPAPPPTSYSEQPPMPVRTAIREMPGAFPGAPPTSPHLYRSSTPSRDVHPSLRDLDPGFQGLGIRDQSSSKQTSKRKTTPVEPYQYHNFSSSSSTQSSPKQKYTRRVSSAESSYTAMPRRVPVPASRPAPAQASYPESTLGPRASSSRVERPPAVLDEDLAVADVDVQTDSGKSVKSSSKHASASGGGKDGERRRKSGKSRKKH